MDCGTAGSISTTEHKTLVHTDLSKPILDRIVLFIYGPVMSHVHLGWYNAYCKGNVNQLA